jgi:hypothetical protein
MSCEAAASEMGVPMKALNAHQRRLAGLARSVRAAIVVPSLLALALLVVTQPEVARFAVFGTFAHLTMVDYNASGRARSAEAAMLTLLGAIMIGLGTLASAKIWLSVGGAVAVGFVTEFSVTTGGRIAVIRTALLLSFMLGVAVPTSVSCVYSYLEGWLLAGIVAQPVLLWLWIPLQRGDGVREREPSGENITNPRRIRNSLAWIGDATGTGGAMGIAVLVTRLLKLDHAFWVVPGVLRMLSADATSATRTFWQQQGGTLMGCVMGACLVAIIGAQPAGYWLILPFIVFAAAYASSTAGFTAGQAGFTVFAVVLFCILLPQQRNVGILRVEDIAIGGAIGLAIGSLRHLGHGRRLDCLQSALQV